MLRFNRVLALCHSLIEESLENCSAKVCDLPINKKKKIFIHESFSPVKTGSALQYIDTL